MSDGPITRDPDMVKMPRDQWEFMIETTRTLSRIEQKLESHLIDDKVALAMIHERLDGQSGVVSSITEDRSELKGMWKTLTMMAITVASIAGLIIAWVKK